ncbi:MAG TPA: histone deacetylase family protein [Usitatibacter sp.]|jgi:acetoin utilization deacetylase AcuC-like enzyme|nr:histone deacetylase family protein [Usitatibacter sp.]
MKRCAWITHAACRLHEMGPGHPECPERLDAISDYLLSTGLMQLLVPYDAPAATEEQLGRAHAANHVRTLIACAPREGYLQLDPDTAMGPGSLEAALHAAGAAVLATDLVLRGEAGSAFCAVRPPGHHATRGAAMGFCLFNNVAVGMRHALHVHGLERVALVDFDVHHGNGSEDIFAGDERVLMVSTFQSGLYPFSGDEALAPNMANVGLAPGATGEALKDAYEYVWKPRLDEFRPQMIFISAGFDAHRADDMAGLRWIERDYAWITRRICEDADRHCEGRIVSCLEGGYHLFHLARSVAAHVRELAGAD